MRIWANLLDFVRLVLLLLFVPFGIFGFVFGLGLCGFRIGRAMWDAFYDYL